MKEEKNIELSSEDIKKVSSALQKEKDAELSDEELKDIAAGTKKVSWWPPL